MITFVYCCVCLLIVCCQTTSVENQDYDYTNDSPDPLPKVAGLLSYKVGSDIVMKCDHHFNKDITWEFKHCQSNYKEIHCDKRNMYRLDKTGRKWKKLNTTKSKLEIRDVTENSTGLYRCLYKASIVKIYIVHVIGPAKYIGPSPKVLSLIPSTNSTILPNSHFAIQCYVSSVMPPEIRWLKKCNGHKCEVKDNGHCYCAVPTENPSYATRHNVYLSKLNIYKSRDIDSGTYICLVMSMYGKDYKNITIKVQDLHDDEETNKSFSLLFLIPLCFVLVPLLFRYGCVLIVGRRKIEI